MKLKIIYILLIFLVSTNIQNAKADDYYSYSLGQFDANDSYDSFEQRVEYLSNKVFVKKYNLKPFVGLMLNTDSGKYLYSGLRKDISLSNRWNITPSFAVGYYDRGSSKDLGHNLEFRSQLELSYSLNSQNRIGISLNHISNASIADTNPGTESLVLSLIRPF